MTANEIVVIAKRKLGSTVKANIFIECVIEVAELNNFPIVPLFKTMLTAIIKTGVHKVSNDNFELLLKKAAARYRKRKLEVRSTESEKL